MTTPEIICEMVRKRAAIGLGKYGVTVDRADITLAQWVRHAQEEMLDGAQYLERVKQEHAEAIEEAFREGFKEGHWAMDIDEEVLWDGSKAKRKLEQ